MWIIQIFSRKIELSILDKSRMEPEVERTVFIVSWHITCIGLKQDLGVAPQHRAVCCLYRQNVGRAVVMRLTIDLKALKLANYGILGFPHLLPEVSREDGVGSALVNNNPEVGSISLAHKHHPHYLDLRQLERNLYW